MSHTKLLYHIVFRTWQSVPAINEENDKQLYEYIWSFCQRKKSILWQINGIPDHIHLLVEIHQSLAVSDFVKQLKNASHKWIENNPHLFPDFYAWSKGYCALTYSQRDKFTIMQYIKNQKLHHQTENCIDEIKRLLLEEDVSVSDYFEQDF